LERKTFQPGGTIFLEGEPADNAYLIEEGQVELTKRKDNDVVVIGLVGRGEMIGEMALIDSALRSLSARCSEKTTVIVVPEEEFISRLDIVDPVIRRVLHLLIDRLRDQTQATADKGAARNRSTLVHLLP